MTRTLRTLSLVILLAALLPPVAAAQGGAPHEAPVVKPLKLSGPRAGITYLSPGVQEKVEEVTGHSVMPVITQFGWQWETRLFAVDTGVAALSEWVLLVGGMDQGLFLPSLTWLVGLRSAGGAEFGVGPNGTPAGLGLAAAAGITLSSGGIYFPINVAVVPSRKGPRMSMLMGFNMRNRE
jgi:hypothetical protein